MYTTPPHTSQDSTQSPRFGTAYCWADTVLDRPIVSLVVTDCPDADTAKYRVIDTSRHPSTCLCEGCAINGTGEIAMRELMADSPDGIVTTEIYAAFLELVTQRGKGR